MKHYPCLSFILPLLTTACHSRHSIWDMVARFEKSRVKAILRMDREKNHIMDKVIIVIAWLMALAFAFLVYQKFSLMFH
jgi:hypothetical protein